MSVLMLQLLRKYELCLIVSATDKYHKSISTKLRKRRYDDAQIARENLILAIEVLEGLKNGETNSKYNELIMAVQSKHDRESRHAGEGCGGFHWAATMLKAVGLVHRWDCINGGDQDETFINQCQNERRNITSMSILRQ